MATATLIRSGGRGTTLALTEKAQDAKVLSKEPAGESSKAVPQARTLRQIPSSMWTDKMEERIKLYIDDELNLADGERWNFMYQLSRWREAYKAPLPQYPKNFPLANSSNMTVPIIKEIVNTLAAQIAQMTTTATPTWVFESLAPEWEPFLDDIEEFIDIASQRDLNLKEQAIPWIVECCKFGTAIMETAYEVDIRKTYAYTADGKSVYPHEQVVHDGPVTFAIPLSKFWIRFTETDIQRARWVGKEIEMNEPQLRDMEAQGKFYDVDKVLDWYGQLEGPQSVGSGDQPNIADKKQEELEEKRPTNRQGIGIFEIWIRWDIDGDKRYEELRLYYHRASRTFIGRQFAPYWHGRRPFSKIVYFPVEHRFYGEGLCEMLEGIQEEISTQHNQRIDSSTMANLFMIIKRKMVRGLRPGDPLYSGKIIEVNDIYNDIREFKMSEPSSSTVANEQISHTIAERLSGASDATMGRAMPVTRTTATAQMALLQEQAKRVDLTVTYIRMALDQVGFFTTTLYFQFGVNGKAITWMGEQRGKVVEAIFKMPKRVLELGMAIRATTPTSQVNREQKRQNAIALFNLMNQMYQQLIPLIQLVAPNSMPEIVHEMVFSAHRFMQTTLETFETPDVDALLAGLTVLEKVLPAPEDMGGMESYQRAEESAKRLEQLSRLEDLLSQADRAAAGSNGVRPFSPGQGGGLGTPPILRGRERRNGSGGEPTNRRGGRRS